MKKQEKEVKKNMPQSYYDSLKKSTKPVVDKDGYIAPTGAGKKTAKKSVKK